ncbi:GNAT family N-acetyltransferase [Flammeovirga agarivorans]|uniref:GNAT family N-acetyltransferase n=1 Tax=Flammeovirga agarivorans TaxID=2726742 RepID=A0A7X8XW73_9BACT|nr:GNAT family protein [Flammeovirga agarivorans]NLR91966.1 GNAT family N-acetyltransferase [Flammeovirga agarivorans]
MQKWLNKTELEGALVKLIPLTLEHKEELLNAASDGELWKLWFTSVPSINTIDKYLEKALEDYQLEKSLPFVVIDKKTNKVIGSTRFTNAVTHHKRVEIGYTWYAKSYQKTGVNTECKFLLLRHAFETLHCIAVEFRTHWHNQASRKAIARLGAKQDGVLRNHQIGEDGTLRDTVVFSIVRDEWAVTKKSLLFKLNQ